MADARTSVLEHDGAFEELLLVIDKRFFNPTAILALEDANHVTGDFLVSGLFSLLLLTPAFSLPRAIMCRGFVRRILSY